MFEDIREDTGTTARRRADSKYKVVDEDGKVIGYADTKAKASDLAYTIQAESDGIYICSVIPLTDNKKPTAKKTAAKKPTKPKTAKKSSTTKSTPKKKSTAKKPSSKANKPTKQGKTYANTPKKKTSNSKNDNYLTIADFKKGYDNFKSKIPGYKKKSKEIAIGVAGEVAGPVIVPVAGAYIGQAYLKKKYKEHKSKKQAKKIEKHNAEIKSNFKTDENGVIIADEPISSPKKKRFKFW